MTPAASSRPAADLRAYGFAPGNYLCRCGDCRERFSGDKRALRCEPCAQKLAEAAASRPAAAETIQQQEHIMNKEAWIDAAARRCLELGYSVRAALQEAEACFESCLDDDEGGEEAVLKMDPANTVYQGICDGYPG